MGFASPGWPDVSAPGFSAIALTGMPLIKPQDDLVAIILAAARHTPWTWQDGDVIVVSSKIVSKAEGRQVALADVTPSLEAVAVAAETSKDARIVELILRESTRISRKARNVLVTEHRLGFVSANAGIDQSNVGVPDHVLLLPVDPDATADQLRRAIAEQTGTRVGVVISDTHGRPFRQGNVGVAIGVSGLPAITDLRGEVDLFGRVLVATVQGYADLIASAAHLLCGEGAEGRPVIVLRGLSWPPGEGRAADLYRDPQTDLYR